MGAGDDGETFKVMNFTGDGVAKLRDRVSEKLKEFMGDYTDDTLVEYVIVLLKNGRSKVEARNELNVFLGDDSGSFVSWLWDHLGTNLHLYVYPRESRQDEAPKIKPLPEDQVVTSLPDQLNSDSDRTKSGKLSRSRHNREWKSLVRNKEEPPPFESTVTEKINRDEKTHRKASRALQSTSPQKVSQKRNRPEELQQGKRGIISQGSVGASRRLLQSAVREAVATSRPSIPTSEPVLKRLRSVVSTSAASSMSTAIRAVEEAAKDVSKNSFTGNVFDRLGLGENGTHAKNQCTEFDEHLVGDVDYGVIKEIPAQTRPSHLQGSHFREYDGDMSMLETETCGASDSASDNEGYDHVNVAGRRVTGVYHTSTSSVNEVQDSLMVQYSVAQNGEKIMQNRRKEQDQPATVTGTSSKIVNISVNVNTWKPSHYQEQGEIQHVDNRKKVQEIESSLGRSSVWSKKDNPTTLSVVNRNIIPVADVQKESPKMLPATHGIHPTGRPTEDADSRTIFVSNVHFAATKDSLSRHFNKFGEVLKVIIVTDAATGQPKGSAYVEFMRKEAAENALSLDGTSFMSRILKVMKKSAAHQDAASIMTWPRAVRGSPFGATTRFGRGIFPRGMHHGVYRGRPPIKPGARSLQWKREEAHATSEEPSSSIIPSTNSVRSLTYVRTDLNTNE